MKLLVLRHPDRILAIWGEGPASKESLMQSPALGLSPFWMEAGKPPALVVGMITTAAREGRLVGEVDTSERSNSVAGVLMTIRSNRNVVYRCSYRVVWCPKYRWRVLAGEVGARLKELIPRLVAEKRGELDAFEVLADRVHVLVAPRFGVHRLVKHVKRVCSRLLRQEFAHLRSGFPSLWTNSNFVATTGGATLDVVRR
jgi:putative transposase